MAEKTHSRMFAKIKYYYEEGFWKKFMVYNVVAKNAITPAEYEEITGEPYVKPQPVAETEETTNETNKA